MNDYTITRLPTLVNIEKMGIKELREHYRILEGDAISQALQLSDVCAKLAELTAHTNNLAVMLGALADSYEAGDQAAILLQVKQLAERRASYRSEQKGKVH